MAVLSPLQQTLQFYEFKVTPANAALIGLALQKLPMEQVYPLVMDLEQQIQGQNFQLEQKAIQDKVAETNTRAIALAAEQQLDLKPDEPIPDPPVVDFGPDEPIGTAHPPRKARNGRAAHA